MHLPMPFPEDASGPKFGFKRKTGFKRILCRYRPCAAGNGEHSERDTAMEKARSFKD